MIPQQANAYSLLPAKSYTNAGTAKSQFSRDGYDYAKVMIHFGALATNADVPTVMKISESDDTVVTNAVAIVALTGGTQTSTSVGFVIPATAVLGESVVELNIDLRKRKRYLMLDITSGTTTVVFGAIVELGRAKQSPDTTATKSITNLQSSSTTACSLVVVA